MLTELLVILILILFNGVLSASEIAIVSSRKARLQASVSKKKSSAKLALELKESPNNFLSTIQIGITLIGILTGFFSGGKISTQLTELLNTIPALAPYSSNISIALVVFVITYFSLVLGELVPKRIGMAIPERYAMAIAYPMHILSLIVKPFVWLLSISTDAIVKLFNIKSSENAVTEEEIKAIVDEGVSSGAIEGIEHDIVNRLLHLGDKKALNLMTHRNNIIYLDLEDSFEEHKRIILQNEHSIYPICDGGIDNILGIIQMKQLFREYLLNKERIDLKSLIQPIKYVNENSSAYSIMSILKSSHMHQAIVIDEYGSIQGIITLQDIIFGIVGNFPSDDIGDKPSIRKREDGSYLIDGQYQLEDLLEKFNNELTEDEQEEIGSISTIGGLIFLFLDHVPEEGEKIIFRNLALEVIDMDGNRIDKVICHILPPQSESENYETD